jgi:hypothetical protein
MTQSLLNLLNDQSVDLITLEQILHTQYNDVIIELILLYFQANKLCQLSIKYSQERIIRGKPIIEIPTVKGKLEYAKAMLAIYQSILISDIARENIIMFIRTVLSNVLEKLLQIYGASGYMKHNLSTELWLDCRNRISQITHPYEYENLIS